MGEQLGADLLRKEGEGFAIAAGSVRFYFIYSKKFPNAAILVRARFKTYSKLAKADRQEMLEAFKSFDQLTTVPR